MIIKLLALFWSFFKIGVVGFGGGYTMLSVIMTESAQFAVSTEQFADLTALDMVIPGPIAINAATYVGYLYAGTPGALAATVGVSLPSFLIVGLVMRFIERWRDSLALRGILAGIKPAAVGMIAAAATIIAAGVLILPGAAPGGIFSDPFGTVSWLAALIFIAVAVLNIRFKVNPILLTVLAGILGGFFLQ